MHLSPRFPGLNMNFKKANLLWDKESDSVYLLVIILADPSLKFLSTKMNALAPKTCPRRCCVSLAQRRSLLATAAPQRLSKEMTR